MQVFCIEVYQLIMGSLHNCVLLYFSIVQSSRIATVIETIELTHVGYSTLTHVVSKLVDQSLSSV